ncbi:hypothetical protein ACO2XV_13590 [Escherichia coli]
MLNTPQRDNNAGAWFVDLLAERLRAPLREEAKFFGYTSRVTLGGEDVRLFSPDYIYESQRQSRCGDGQFFPALIRTKFWWPTTNWILPPGVAKFKLGGGHGGHNGLKDIISKLGNNPNFHRLRIGIGRSGR